MLEVTDLCFTAILIFAAIYDIKYHKIPDILHLGIVVITCSMWLKGTEEFCITEMSFFVETVAGMFVIAGIMIFTDLIKAGAFGGGDIKLAFFAGLYLGWQRMIAAGFMTVIAAGISCMCMLILKNYSLKTKVPLAPYLAIGMIISIYRGKDIFIWLFG